MPPVLVIQSHRSPLPWPWVERCLASVRGWCAANGYGYRVLGDELFDGVPRDILDKTRRQPVVATDLGRLLRLREALAEGHETVVWLDADVLVFDVPGFVLPDTPCAVGREVWVQPGKDGRPKSYRKVHNAFLMFRQGDSFLDFYLDTATRLLLRADGPVPPQFIGPKLLTALHNVAGFPVLESAGMLSPAVIRDILAGGGPALALFGRRSAGPLAAANLCTSSCDRGEISAGEMARLVDRLLGEGRLPMPSGVAAG